MTAPPAATPPYDHEALWTKAKLFINRAMDETPPRTFDEQALWASLALELLAKAALAKHSPLLIALPNEEGTNLLIASGLMQGDAQFNSIAAHTLFTRCSLAFRPFSARDANNVARARNDYLHGPNVNFAVIPAEAWWSRYWPQARILVEALDMDLDDFVGHSRLDSVNEHLERNKKNIEHRVESLISRAKQRIQLQAAGRLTAKVAAEMARPVSLTLSLAHSIVQPCPACGSEGNLEGEVPESVEIKHEQASEEDWDSWAEITVGSDYFSCNNCRLVLDGYEIITEAGLPENFFVIGDASDYDEPEYGND